MSLPPLLMRLRLESPGHRKVRLWLPLFLLWPVLVVLMLLALVVAVIADVVLFLVGHRYYRWTLLLIGSLDVLGQARGTRVLVNGNRSIVELAIL